MKNAMKHLKDGRQKMIKLILAVIFVAVVLLLIIVTIAGILEAKSMEWETRTIGRKEDHDDSEMHTID